MKRTPLQIIQDAEGKDLQYEPGGSADCLELLPPLEESEIVELEERIPCPLPDSVRQLLQCSRGFATGPLESLEFSGLEAFEFPDLFPCPIDLAHDGFGNYWIVDLTSDSTEWGPICFVCHDPPVIVLQCKDLSTFLEETLKLGHPQAERSELDAVHEDHVMRVWSENPGLLDRQECLDSGDPVLVDFSGRLTDDFHIKDMRTSTVGDGFSWGRYGAKTVNRRAGEEPVFAYQKRSRWQRVKDWMGVA